MSRHAAKQIFNNQLFQKIVEIDATNAHLTFIFDVSKLKNLEELFLTGNKIRKFDNKIFEGCSNLKKVFLDKNKIRIPKATPILISESIEMLSLAQNGFRKINRITFKGLPKLKYLYLEGNFLTSIPFKTFINLNNLKFLNLIDNPLKDLGFGKPQTLKERYILYEIDL